MGRCAGIVLVDDGVEGVIGGLEGLFELCCRARAIGIVATVVVVVGVVISLSIILVVVLVVRLCIIIIIIIIILALVVVVVAVVSVWISWWRRCDSSDCFLDGLVGF